MSETYSTLASKWVTHATFRCLGDDLLLGSWNGDGLLPGELKWIGAAYIYIFIWPLNGVCSHVQWEPKHVTCRPRICVFLLQTAKVITFAPGSLSWNSSLIMYLPDYRLFCIDIMSGDSVGNGLLVKSEYFIKAARKIKMAARQPWLLMRGSVPPGCIRVLYKAIRQ